MAKKIILSFSQYTISLEAGANIKSTISVINRGSVVDQFSVEVEGLEESWYTLSASSVKLFPGAQESITLTIHPPKESSSKAGKYPFSVKATSVDNPKEVATELGTLEIQPYHEFGVELHPTQRVTRGEADFQLSIRNRGNSRETFKFNAQDEQGACQFRFEDEEVKLDPGESSKVSLWVAAKSRPKFGAKKQYSFQVNVIPGWDKEAAQTVAGQVAYLAMVPRWLVRAIVPVIAVIIAGIWFLWPVKEPIIESFSVSPDSLSPGGSALLSWEVRQAKSILIQPEPGNVKATDSLRVSPKKSTTYTLMAKSRRGKITKKKDVSLVVVYPLPEIISFEAQPQKVKNPTKGVTLTWKVERAKKVKIEPDIGDVAATGSKVAYPEKTTTFTLTATNEGGDVEKGIEVILESDRASFDRELQATVKKMKDFIATGKHLYSEKHLYDQAVDNFGRSRKEYTKFRKKYGTEPTLKKLDSEAARWIRKVSLQTSKESAFKVTRGIMQEKLNSGKAFYQAGRQGEAKKDFEACIKGYRDFRKKFGKQKELAALSATAQGWIKKMKGESSREGLLAETKKAMKEHNGLGKGFHTRGEYDQAIQEFKASLDKYKKFKAKFGVDPQLKALSAEAEKGLKKAEMAKELERR